MFLTSLIATFIAGLSLSNNTSSVVKQNINNLAHVSFTCEVGSITGQENKAYLTYVGTDSNGNSYSTNLFYFYIFTNNVNECNLVYGYNSIENNTGFSGTFYSDIFGRKNVNYVPEYLSNSLDFEIDVSSAWFDYSPASNDTIDFDLYFTLLDEGTYNYFDTNSSYNTGYNAGYDIGYSDGSSTGYGNGYQTGFSEAREQYESQSETVNSIFSGILSIGLIPLEFFMSIFNFSILGVNITSIISAILSLMIIVILLRIVLGGKSGKE